MIGYDNYIAYNYRDDELGSILVRGLAFILFTFGVTLLVIQAADRWEIETNLREWRRKRAARRWWAEFQTWRNRRG